MDQKVRKVRVDHLALPESVAQPAQKDLKEWLVRKVSLVIRVNRAWLALKETPERMAKTENRVNLGCLENLDLWDCLERWGHREKWVQKVLPAAKGPLGYQEKRETVGCQGQLVTLA